MPLTKKTQVLLSLAMVFFLGLSCTTLGKKGCKQGDWVMAGYKDALAGKPQKFMDQQVQACSNFGITINTDEYTEGYESGLRKFCTFKSGYNFGRDNHKYQDSCPSDLEPDFFKGYVEGQKAHSLKNDD